MSRQFSLFCAVFALAVFISCSKDKASTIDNYGNSPATALPGEFDKGLWFWGNFGPISYYDQNGHEVGNETEAARQYDFSEVNGKARLEFTQYLGLRNSSNCVTEIYTTKKGTVAFEGSAKLTFYPVEGNFRTIRKGCSDNGTETRAASAEDLKAESYFYEVKVIDGSKLLYLYDSNDEEMQNPVFVYEQAN
jgi:hypothetical protein